ncbi:DUF1697 domain-containing protein [Streptomyces sp. NPDC005963]|uniref:DUF1697 domain-containing protein n=1 Tax=Streptomyces sp. NPDC005963 TaxID=3156721 RepID=UPI0033C17BFF
MTTRYALLLRGINVGGSRKVPMAALKGVLTDLGHADVTTYLQSGNAAFSSASGDDEEALATAVEHAIEKHFGFAVDCLVRDHAYLTSVRDDCPFPAEALEPKQLHVTYFSERIAADRLAAVDQASFAPEEYRLGDRSLYLYAPDGLGRSKLAEALAKPRLLPGVIATTRNWNTVRKLVELTAQ